MKTAIPKINVDKLDTTEASFIDLPLQVLVTAYFVGLTSKLQKAVDEGKLEGAVAHLKSLEASFIGLLFGDCHKTVRVK